ncbi:hypothetical protein L1987_08773 [Smallanthus sonchifolius]|uniref:Uncharacterized protein n=1 Tax=Smallanthus sonchifolius TaxID=185202 RepID=A0ACB9JL50_9ASTR|nr:hypothetical protein L1987_08773 [Smallanthus sonchifolius]
MKWVQESGGGSLAAFDFTTKFILQVAVEEIDEKMIVKIGPKMDLGNLIPKKFQLATSREKYAVWDKEV